MSLILAFVFCLLALLIQQWAGYSNELDADLEPGVQEARLQRVLKEKGQVSGGTSRGLEEPKEKAIWNQKVNETSFPGWSSLESASLPACTMNDNIICIES